MVRPDDADELGPEGGGSAASCCTVPAGESPARVSAGAPGSRPQVRGEILEARAGCRKPVPCDRERSCGPQRAVNAEQASSDHQPKGAWEGRAPHFRAKATDSVSVPESA